MPYSESSKGWTYDEGPEWLMRTCATCGFWRAEMCADVMEGLSDDR